MPDKIEMKKTGRKMGLLMGVTLSFFLSLTGTFTSGHFTVQSFLMSFLVSVVISILIGFFIPVGLLTNKAVLKAKLTPGTFPARLLESFISDLIYTPLLTALMVFLAYKNARGMGAPVNYLQMFMPSLIICFVTGFIIIFIIQPVYLKLLKKDKKEKKNEDKN